MYITNPEKILSKVISVYGVDWMVCEVSRLGDREGFKWEFRLQTTLSDINAPQSIFGTYNMSRKCELIAKLRFLNSKVYELILNGEAQIGSMDGIDTMDKFIDRLKELLPINPY